MPLLESDAIILKTYPLGEADRIVAFFSREHGKVRGVANGARKMKNRFGASLEPLTHSRIQFFEKENRDLVRIQSAEMRSKKQQHTEEKAAKLAVKLVFPIILCFMPVFMIVTVLPSVLSLIENW